MSKLKFKGKTVYTKTCVDNIVKLALKHGNPSDRDWYMHAHAYAQELADRHNTSTIIAAGVIAALSPQKSWTENKRLANQFLAGNERGHTGANLAKAKQIKQGGNCLEEICDILHGLKTSSFFINITLPTAYKAVTIDRHAVEIALNKKLDNHAMTVNQYTFFSNCYTIAAKRLGLYPHQIQAITWEAWRELKKTL